MTACIAEPISWLRLEQYALTVAATADAADIDAHVAQCAACREALESLRADTMALPALPVFATQPTAAAASATPAAQRTGEVIAIGSARAKPASSQRWRAPLILAPILAAAAAGMLWLRSTRNNASPANVTAALHATTSIKGVGDLALQLARDRDGNVQTNVTTFRPGDRWKALLTCAPSTANAGTPSEVWADVVVLEIIDGNPVAEFPQPPTQLSCGNAVAVPGAFAITGARNNIICVTLGVGAPIDRAAIAAHHWQGAAIVCSEVTPE